MQRNARAITRLILLGSIAVPCVPATQSDLERKFDQTVRPFLTAYCTGCHGGASPAAQFDLRPYSTMTAVVRDYGHWMAVLDKLTAGQMPPKPAKQPPVAARKEVVSWIEAMRASEAQKNAGDPGLVLARRLSNAEYNYT